MFLSEVSSQYLPQENQKIVQEDFKIEELKKLLGTLVPAILRDGEGKLDLSKIHAKSFEEFREFLATQVAVDDKTSFSFHNFSSEPYAQLIRSEKYEPLLRSLWRGSQGKDVFQINSLLYNFRSELIQINAAAFVSSEMPSRNGVQGLRSILTDTQHYSKDDRLEISKAIASKAMKDRVHELAARHVTRQVSLYNSFNWGVSSEQAEIAVESALEVLSSYEFEASQSEKLQKREEKDLGYISLFRSSEEGVEITKEKYQTKLESLEKLKNSHDPIDQMKQKLLAFWIFTANSRNYRAEYGASKDLNPDPVRAYALKGIEALLEKVEQVQTEEDFKKLNESTRNFLTQNIPTNSSPSPLAGEGEISKLLEQAEHLLTGRGLEDYFHTWPEEARCAFDSINQLSKKMESAWDMGESIAPRRKLQKPTESFPLAFLIQKKALRNPGSTPLEVTSDALPNFAHSWSSEEQKAIDTLISTLDQTKWELWDGYKHHKLASRIGSGIADLADSGDRVDIRRANIFLDQQIQNLKNAKDKSEIEAVTKALYQEMKAGGKLHQAFDAASMDLKEQIVGLIQTAIVTL
ncbi:MAG: hypothetical protein JNK65_09505, partial [Deltaproteobacteria bacterium]|nr:hypothetical protein [Deltaproteobacteria bacterium]